MAFNDAFFYCLYFGLSQTLKKESTTNVLIGLENYKDKRRNDYGN